MFRYKQPEYRRPPDPCYYRGMLETLLQFIGDKLGTLSPVVVIDQFEKGVLLRLGKYNKTLEPGLHGKLPIIDAVLTVEAVQTTLRIQPQTLTTKDGVTVTTSAVLRYEIHDPKSFLLDVWEGRDAVNDIALAEIKQTVTDSNWEDLRKSEAEKEIIKNIRRSIKDYGVAVKKFGFADLARMKTIRLVTNDFDSGV